MATKKSGPVVGAAASRSSSAGGQNGTEPRKRRRAIAQTDMPAFPLSEAERVPRALVDEYAGSPVTPLDLARALKMQPNGGFFRMLVGASAGYSLTDGSAWAERIGPTDLGRRAMKPEAEGDDIAARREALMRPRVIREFLKKYNGGKVPREDIAHNVLEGMDVPPQETKRVFKQILADARLLGLLTDINGVEYVQLDRPYSASPLARPAEAAQVEPENSQEPWPPELVGARPASPPTVATAVSSAPQEAKRVYITHGSNKDVVELLKRFLKYGDMESVVSEQHQTTSIAVPGKVIDDMRKCGAAIIHVDAERKLIDQDGREHVILNENVLIEIGAAMALYGERFILLVKEGMQLPSNLQGLYQVRYSREQLDADAAMRLLEAIADIKNRPLPGASK